MKIAVKGTVWATEVLIMSVVFLLLIWPRPPVRNGLRGDAGKPLNFLDDSLAVGQVVLQARPLLPGHSLNLQPRRLLHLLVLGQVEDAPTQTGYHGLYGLADKFCNLNAPKQRG